MPYISSANIACGFHAGDPVAMRCTVRAALRHGVAIGAHPGFRDLAGFGRKEMNLPPEEVYAIVLYQVGALQAIARAEGGQVRHVKPHGALYNMAAKDARLAAAIAAAVRDADPNLLLFGLSGSELTKAGRVAGLRCCEEVFADRSYEPDGSLTPRSQPGSVYDDPEKVKAQALQLAVNQSVVCSIGETIHVKSDTICLHGDGPHALLFAKAVLEVFRQEGVVVGNYLV
jgi:UPF0271 protein